MRFLLNVLIDPLFLALAVIGAGMLFLWKNRQRQARMCFFLSGSWIAIMAVTPLSTFLAKQLEYTYPVITHQAVQLDSRKPIHIVVLGGGLSIGEGVTTADQLSSDALSRIVEGIRLHRQIPGSRIVTSGYSIRSKRSQADLLASTSVELGVSPADTLWLPTPTSTREEAAAYLARFGSHNQIILVTSALHLPRAMGWFQHQGLHPIPAPANHLIKIDPDRWTYHWRPSLRKISIMQKVFHEYAGHAELALASRSK